MAAQAFGNYQLIKKLATGGMAEVWLARQVGIEGFNRHVVVKRILPHLSEDPEFVQMFLNEAKIASRFSHPNIAQIFDLGQTDGQYFIAMEFIHGEDLGRLMRKAWSTGQWIARPLAIRIVAEACKGLFYAHTRKDEQGQALKVVHRDISPQNILISFDGSVKVVDFGIAKAADQASMTKSGAIKGKFAYMAPEQAAGKPLDARTDMFALGLVLYELLTGVRPLKRDSELATLQAALECAIEPPSVVAEVPNELDEVVMRALAKAPDDRYRDTSQFQMALEEFLIGQRLVATSVQISELMETLFADRLSEEAKLGAPNPASQDSMQSLPVAPAAPAPRIERGESATPYPEVSRGGNTDAAGPGEAGGRRRSEPEWEAPPAPAAIVQPSRRYSSASPGNQGTAVARSPSGPAPAVRGDETRARPPTAEELPAADDRKSRANGRRASNPAMPRVELFAEDDPLRQTADDGPEPAPAPPRRSSSSQNVRRSSIGLEMPPAPVRRSRPSLDALKVKPGKKDRGADRAGDGNGESNGALDKATGDLELLKGQQARLRRNALIVAAALGLGGGGYLMRDVLFTSANERGGGVPIILSVNTDPRTMVTVVHPERNGKKPPDTVLGETPVENQTGVFVGDILQMISVDQCISDEVPLLYGQPNEQKKIDRRYAKGKLKVTVQPPMKGVSVYCFGQSIGTVGLLMDFYAGTHKLELRGDSLAEPVPFEVTIEAGKTATPTVKLDLGGKK